MAVSDEEDRDRDRALLRLVTLLARRAHEKHGIFRADGWVWSLPLPPRRQRPGKGAAAPDDPEPEAMHAGACRHCGQPVDLRESGGDPDGGWSHLECWAEAGRPEVGRSQALAARPEPFVTPPPPGADEQAPPPPKPHRSGDRCKVCGEPIDWRRPGAVAFRDRTYAHLRCYETSP